MAFVILLRPPPLRRHGGFLRRQWRYLTTVLLRRSR